MARGYLEARSNRKLFVCGILFLRGHGEWKAALALTPDLSIIDLPREKHSDEKLLSFPLEVGKQWSYVDDIVFNDQFLGTVQNRTNMSVAVLGYEKVRVPAGEFDAFKLEAKGNWVSPRAPGPATIQVTYWYAPAVRAILKKEEQATGVPTYITELVEFQLQP